ncbi:MAG: signal peptidase I [Anaerolineales bacterium]
MKDFRSEQIPDPQLEQSPRGGVKRFARDILEISLISLFLFISINTLSARIRIESVSMEPTLYAGNFVVVNKLAYRFADPSRGDIIVFRYPPNPEQVPYIKRVIGLPGDHLEVRSGEVQINGVRIAEPYLHSSTRQGGEWTVPPDSLFVMGDNRNNSSDSRSWGFVPMENVIGKALVVYWPPNKWELLDRSYAVAAEP